MRILIPIIATILLALPASGGELLVFPDKRADNPDICEANPDNIPAKDKAFNFVPIEGCRVAQHYGWNASGYFHNPHPAPDLTPRPDRDGAIDQIAEDATINTGSFLIAVKCLRIKDPTKRKAEWATKAAGINAAQKLSIENAAAAHNVPLKD